MATSRAEFKLPFPPFDKISRVRFYQNLHNSELLLVSSWDKKVRLYNTEKRTLESQYEHHDAVLDCCFSTEGRSFSGGYDRVVRSFDFTTATQTALGLHADKITCMEYFTDLRSVVTGSADCCIKFWNSGRFDAWGEAKLTSEILALGIQDKKFLVATQDRQICVFDVRNLDLCLDRYLAPNVDDVVTTVHIHPDQQRYIVTTNQGHIGFRALDPSIDVDQTTCITHQLSFYGKTLRYSINSLDINPSGKTFATGASDGFVFFYDAANCERLSRTRWHHTSVTSVNYNLDGTQLAIGCSFHLKEYEQPRTRPNDIIFIRNFTGENTPIDMSWTW